MNYNLLLCLGIWAIFLALLVVPLPAGRGVLTLTGNHGVRLALPSWRFSLGRQRFLVLNPWHLFRPSLTVAVFAAATAEDTAVQIETMHSLYAQFAFLRDGLLLLAVCLLVLIPVSVTMQGGAGLLSLIAFVYLAYVALWGGTYWRKEAVRSVLLAHWAMLAEPLLCLPLAPHSLRKLFAAVSRPVALMDVLTANIVTDVQQLQGLQQRLAEMREVIDDEAQQLHLQQLMHLVASRLPQQEALP